MSNAIVQPKPASASKTVWLNALTFGAALLSFAAGHEFIQEYPRVVEAILAVNAALNIVLRIYFTRQPIG